MCFSVRQADVCAGKEKRILAPASHGKAQFAVALDPKSHSATLADHRVRFYVRSNAQSALFREAVPCLRR